MTQKQTVLSMLRAGPCTTADFLTFGIPRYSARIKELRNEGHTIETRRLRAGSWQFTLHTPPSKPVSEPERTSDALFDPDPPPNRFDPWAHDLA